ncbi:MAG: Xaa-Pro peptidase family protein [Candidatus Bathyarchaeia archaeon]
MDPDITQEEYQDRLSKAQRLLKQYGLDGLLLTQWENIYYMTGFMGTEAQCCRDTPHAVIVRRDGDAVLIIPEYKRPAAESAVWTKELRGYNPLKEFGNTLIKTFAELGLKSAKIGTELGDSVRMTCVPVHSYLDLINAIGNDFVDGAELIWKLRMVKSKSELDRIRIAAEAASRAADRAFGEISDGMTEREFAHIIGLRMMEEGASRPHIIVCTSGDKFRSGVVGDFAGGRKIRRGEYVDIDFLALYRHYVCDLHRVAFFGGQPPKSEIDHYQLYIDANKKGAEALRPGVTASDVYKAEAEVFEEAGMRVESFLLGHGIGLEAREPPIIARDNTTVLESGMVFSIEPQGIPNAQGVAFNCEDNVAVTETGHELLSTISRELRIV